MTEGTAAVWSAATGAKVSTLCYLEGVDNAAFSPDGHHVMMFIRSGWLQSWDLNAPAEDRDLRLPTNAVALSWRGDGKRFVVGLIDNTARLFGAERLTPAPPTLWHEDTVNQALFTPTAPACSPPRCQVPCGSGTSSRTPRSRCSVTPDPIA